MENSNGEALSRQENLAQQFFLYLVKFVALAFLAFAFGSVLFQLIDKNLPDPLQLGFSPEEAFQGMLKFAIAAILIAGPIFLFLSALLARWLAAGKIALDSKVRRWLTYLVLTVVSITAVGDLVTLVTAYLNGDLILNAFLKMLTILLICVAIFGYYLWAIRREIYAEVEKKIDRRAFWGLSGALLFFLGVAFLSVDTPTVAREKKADQQVVSAIQNLQTQIENYYQANKQLPADLSEFQNRKSKYFSELATVLQEKVSYQKQGEKQYQLCGVFQRSNSGQLRGDFEIRWEHTAGQSCYDLEVRLDKDGNVFFGGTPGETLPVK